MQHLHRLHHDIQIRRIVPITRLVEHQMARTGSSGHRQRRLSLGIEEHARGIEPEDVDYVGTEIGSDEKFVGRVEENLVDEWDFGLCGVRVVHGGAEDKRVRLEEGHGGWACGVDDGNAGTSTVKSQPNIQ